MVFVLPVLADIGADLAVIALALCAAWLVLGLAKIIPDPSYFGFHPLSFIRSGFFDLGNYFISAAEGRWHSLQALLTDVAHEADVLGSRLISVIVHHADLLDYIAAVAIPGAISSLDGRLESLIQQQANKESDDHAKAIAAAAAAVAATEALHHLVGNPKAATVEDDVNNAHNDAINQSNAYTDRQIAAFQQAISSRFGDVWSAIGSLDTAVTSTLPDEIASVASQASAESKAALATATDQLQNAVQNLNNNITAGQALDATELNAAVSQLNGAIASASSADQAALSATAVSITAHADQVGAAVAAGDAAALSSAVGGIQTQIDTLKATATIALPGLPDVALPGEITIPVAVGSLAVALAGVITEVDTCMISSCGTGPNSLKNALLRELGLFSAVGELGFLAAAAKDPVGTADALSGVLQGAYDSGVSTLDALLSI